MADNDMTLVAAAQIGDSQAFGQLYDKYFRKIYRFIYYKVGHQETCEDLTSLTFTKALEKIKNLSVADNNFAGWLFTIARHNVIDYYRTQKPVEDFEQYPDIYQDQNPEKNLDDQQMLAKVKKYLENMSEEQREIVIMRVWLEMSYREIGETLNK